MQCSGFLDCTHTFLAGWAPALWVFGCAAAYVLAMLFVRYLWIIRRNTSHLHAYAEMVERRLTAEQDQPEQQEAVEKALTPQITAMLENALSPTEQRRPAWWAFLTLEGIGNQLASWRVVHDADRLSTELWPSAQVAAYAVVAKEELKAVGSPAARALSDAIAKNLDGGATDDAVLRPLVKQARGLIFNARDDYYEELSEWQNKALWLVLVTAGLVVLLAATLCRVDLLLLGATGGLLARLRKTMTAKSVGFDYGVSWSVVFLAPLVGALTGWAGVLISNFVVALHALNLPAAMQSSGALTTNTNMVLAVLFGFSATLFERVMAGAETALTQKPVGGSDGGSAGNK